MKGKSKFGKGLERILASGIIFLGSLVGGIRANEGTLNMYNIVDPNSTNGVSQVRYWISPIPPKPVLEGWDNWDNAAIEVQPNKPAIHMDIEGTTADINCKPVDSKIPVELNFVYNGRVTENKQNWIQFNFPIPEDFGDKPILFQQTSSTNVDAFYPVYDVRKVIEAGVILQLEDVAAGDYDPETPYGSGILDIGTRLLADLDDNGTVDLYDFTPIGQDWRKTNIDSIADISGQNGLPDRNVDMWDLKAYAEDYLMSVED